MATATATRPRTTRKRVTTEAAPSRDIDWQALIDTALTAPGSVGNTYCRFYRYSFTNQMLLLMQGVNEPVATYKRWGEMGRQVQKGSKAYFIVRPIQVKRKDVDDADAPDATYMKFKPVNCLFKVSQTEGDDLPVVESPSWDSEQAMRILGISQVPFAVLDGNIQGYSHKREFALNPVAVDPTKTRFHEIAHIVLGHTGDERDEEIHRGVGEFQADATAYLVMHELGLLTDETATRVRGYIQGWMKNQRPSDTAIKQVFTATDKILRAGLPQTDTAEQ